MDEPLSFRWLICGSRHWTNYPYMKRKLDSLNERKPASVVIEGEQRGADLLGRKWAERRDIPIEPYPADWDQFHKAAGPIRNERMLRSGNPDLVIAFHENLRESRGTSHMISIAKNFGIMVIHYDGEN